jgi:hypothetical protein
VNDEMTISDVALAYGYSRRTAQRLLARLYRSHGDRVVSRRGVRYVTTKKAFEEATARGESKKAHAIDLEERVNELEDLQIKSISLANAQSQKIQELEAALASFRSQAREWFRRMAPHCATIDTKG